MVAGNHDVYKLRSCQNFIPYLQFLIYIEGDQLA